MNAVKRAVAIVNTYKPEAAVIAKKIITHLSGKSVVCDLYMYDGNPSTPSFDSYDFAISLGGDGTVLFAARYCAKQNIPIFPVNLGEFGFIAGIEPNDWETPLNDFLEGNAYGNERMLLCAKVIRNEKTVFTSDALNDAVISGTGIARIVNLSVSFDGHSFGMYKADGIIVATPTGSTAYSAASGGPILAPDVSALILSPICAFSLSNRPIVLPSSGVMQITVLQARHKESILTIDGQEVFILNEGDTIKISEAQRKVRLIGCDTDVFYTALRSKLNWSGTPVTYPVGKDCFGEPHA